MTVPRQRVQTTANSVTRTMIYDIFGQQVADYSGSSLERENIYRGRQLLATYEAGTSALKYVLQDVQGSARAVMSNNGGLAFTLFDSFRRVIFGFYKRARVGTKKFSCSTGS